MQNSNGLSYGDTVRMRQMNKDLVSRVLGENVMSTNKTQQLVDLMRQIADEQIEAYFGEVEKLATLAFKDEYRERESERASQSGPRNSSRNTGNDGQQEDDSERGTSSSDDYDGSDGDVVYINEVTVKKKAARQPEIVRVVDYNVDPVEAYYAEKARETKEAEDREKEMRRHMRRTQKAEARERKRLAKSRDKWSRMAKKRNQAKNEKKRYMSN